MNQDHNLTPLSAGMVFTGVLQVLAVAFVVYLDTSNSIDDISSMILDVFAVGALFFLTIPLAIITILALRKNHPLHGFWHIGAWYMSFFVLVGTVLAFIYGVAF